MRTVDELARAREAALALVARQPDVREAEVFVAANSALLTRLNYTSHIPCNGVEEPKSTESYGSASRPSSTRPTGRADRLRQRAERPHRSPASSARSMKARRAAVADPEFVSLPAPTGASAYPRRLPRSPAHGPRRRGPRRGGLEDHRRRPPHVRAPRAAWRSSRRTTRGCGGSASSSAATSPS